MGIRKDGLNTRLRVLYLVPYLARGGTERHLIDLIRSIQWQDSKPWVAGPDGPSRAELEQAGATWLGVPVLSLGRGSIAAWTKAFQQAVSELDPHVIHVHAGVELLWIIRKLARERPRVFTVHGYHGSGAGVSYWLAGALGGGLAHRVIAVSVSEAQRLSRVPRSRIRVVLNGVSDPQTLGEGTPRVTGVPANAVLVAVASRLERPKGADLVVEAFIRLLQRGAPMKGSDGAPADAHLVVMGSGSQEETLRQRIRVVGLEKRVHLVGHQPRAAELLRGVDVLVQASRQDALPLTVAEAMAAGVPAVVSDSGGLPELVEDGVSGRVVPAGRVEPLEEALVQLLADPDGRARMGRAARHRYETRFTLERFAAETLAVYADLCS